MTLWQHWIVGQVEGSIAAGLLLLIALGARRRLSPDARSALLLIALVRLALPPLFQSPWTEAAVDLPPLDDTRSLVAGWLQSDVAQWAFGVTLAVTIALLMRLAWQIGFGTRAIVRSTEPAPAELQACVDSLCGSTLAIELRLSADNVGPLATGFRRKLVVMKKGSGIFSDTTPAKMSLMTEASALVSAGDPQKQPQNTEVGNSCDTKSTACQQKKIPDPFFHAVLAHEIGHHARRDLYWIAAVSFLRAIVWFNPLAHLIAREIVAAREDGSDDWAIAACSQDPTSYSQALLHSARLMATDIALTPHAALSAGAHPIGNRLKRLLDTRYPSARNTGPFAIAAIVIAAAGCLPGAHMPSLDDSDQRVIVIRRVVEDAVRREINP